MMAKYRPTAREVRNRRVKGKSFERKIAKMIIAAFQAYYDNIADDAVARTPMSGAWYEKGDIVKRDPIIKERFPWTIECKAQKAFPILERLLVKRSKLFQTCWEQAIDQAIEMKEAPLLVWRVNPKSPVLCAVPAEVIDIGEDYMSFEDWAYGSVSIYTFDAFLERAMKWVWYQKSGEYRRSEELFYYFNSFDELESTMILKEIEND